MRALILLLVVACALPSCMSTHGCVGRANHNKKVAMKRHHYRQHHRGSGNTAVSW
jgi:hypothetical protein